CKRQNQMRPGGVRDFNPNAERSGNPKKGCSWRTAPGVNPFDGIGSSQQRACKRAVIGLWEEKSPIVESRRQREALCEFECGHRLAQLRHLISGSLIENTPYRPVGCLDYWMVGADDVFAPLYRLRPECQCSVFLLNEPGPRR